MRQSISPSDIPLLLILALTLIATGSHALSVAKVRVALDGNGAFAGEDIKMRLAMSGQNVSRHGFLSTNSTQNVSKFAQASELAMGDQAISESDIGAFYAYTESLLFYASPAHWHLPEASLKAEFWILVFTSTMIWITFVLLAAYNYKEREPGYFPDIGPLPDDPGKTRRQLSRWQSEWYECGSDPEICIWSFCCPWIRWAHTMDLLHLLEFAPAFAIFFMLQLVNTATGFVFLGVYFTALLVYYRQKVRQVFGMQNYGTFSGMLEDWLCLCFCLPCTIAQEANHVKLAAEMGFPLPACMAEFGGRRKPLPRLLEDDATSSSQSFHDVMSRVSGSCRDSPALPQTEPQLGVFSGLFRKARQRSRSSSRGVGYRGIEPKSKARAWRSRSSSPEPRGERRSGSKAKSSGKAKAVENEACTTPGSIQMSRSPWLREAQNPMPERLLAPPPIRAGQHGEVRSGKLSFMEVLVTLHDDLRAYIFLFAEVGCVGRCGATCRNLHDNVWADRAFWHFYCGPTVNDRLAQPQVCPPHALREAFRRWIFHIDADWTKDFRAFVDQARLSPSAGQNSLMLSYARYIASGLMPYDSRPAVAEFTGIMCELLAEYNPERAEERNAAEAMTAQVECMAEVFTGVQIKSVLSAFDISLGRVIAAEEESDLEPPWVLAGLTGEQEMAAALQEQPGGDHVDPENPWGSGAIMWFG